MMFQNDNAVHIKISVINKWEMRIWCYAHNSVAIHPVIASDINDSLHKYKHETNTKRYWILNIHIIMKTTQKSAIGLINLQNIDN